MLAASLLLITVQAVSAQTETQPAELGKTRTENRQHMAGRHERKAMMKQLNLSEEQKTRLREMNAGNKEKRQAILQNSQLTEEQRRAQLKELRQSEKAHLREVLTDDQKARMKDLQLKRREMKANAQKKQAAAQQENAAGSGN